MGELNASDLGRIQIAGPFLSNISGESRSW